MLQQNIAPSLRQSMINEALDYHQNMNSVVFKRQARNLETYARESGRTDPSPKDVLVEGSIRQKVAEIGTQIQRLNQQLNYAGNTTAPVVGSGGHETSGGRRGKISKARRAARRNPTGEELVSYEDPNKYKPGVRGAQQDMEDWRQRNIVPLPSEEPEFEEELPETSIVPYQSTLGAPAIDKPETSEITISGSEEPSGFPQQVERRPVLTEDLGSDSGESSDELLGESDDDRLSGVPSQFGRSDYSLPSSRSLGAIPPSRVGSFISEPNAPGPTITSSPSAVDSSKLNVAIDSSLAGIVASYNSLMDFIDLQQKQRSFNQQDEQLVSQLLKELVEPLKMLIANSAVAKQGVSRNLIDYTRIYNVISALINKITSSPPFFKVPPGILTEKIPIREDIIQAENYNPEKQANHEYLESLVTRIQSEFDAVIRTSPKSPLEKEARELKLKELQAAYSKITKAGYRKSSEILKDVSAHDELVKDTQFLQQAAQREKEINEEKREDYRDVVKREEYVTTEIEDNLRRLQRINQKLEEDIQKVQDHHRDWEASGEQLEYVLHRLQQAQSDQEAEYFESQVAYFKNVRGEILDEIRDIDQGIYDLDTIQRDIHDRIDAGTFLLEKTRLSEDTQNQLRRDLAESNNNLKELSEREQDIRRLIQHDFPKLSKLKPEVVTSIRKYHEGRTEKEAADKEKRFRLTQQVKSKYKGEFPTFLGEGHDARDGKKSGGHVHKKSADPFGDNSELAPYLTKYLRPSKYRQKVPEIASSSDESSEGEDGEVIRDKVGTGSSKTTSGKKKAVEDFEIIVSAPKADKGFLLAKKTEGSRGSPKRTGGKKKPVHETSPVQDLWFMN